MTPLNTELIAQWHRETTDRAIDELVEQIRDRYGARPVARTPRP